MSCVHKLSYADYQNVEQMYENDLVILKYKWQSKQVYCPVKSWVVVEFHSTKKLNADVIVVFNSPED